MAACLGFWCYWLQCLGSPTHGLLSGPSEKILFNSSFWFGNVSWFSRAKVEAARILLLPHSISQKVQPTQENEKQTLRGGAAHTSRDGPNCWWPALGTVHRTFFMRYECRFLVTLEQSKYKVSYSQTQTPS